MPQLSPFPPFVHFVHFVHLVAKLPVPITLSPPALSPISHYRFPSVRPWRPLRPLREISYSPFFIFHFFPSVSPTQFTHSKLRGARISIARCVRIRANCFNLVITANQPDNAELLPKQPSSFSSRDRFLAACRCQSVDRPPVWLMRQAGRSLPEYRALKEKHTFLELVRTPELATEVTLQPIRRFGFDAAVLFSDILVVPEAMGQPYHFKEQGGGIEMEFAVSSAEDIHRLDHEHAIERLQYVAEALALIKPALDGKTALLGFAGSPWTLARYMVEGSSSGKQDRAKELFYSEPKLFGALMEKITAVVTAFLKLQIASGAEAIQFFDSNGDILADNAYEAASGRWIREIITAIGKQVPVILFSKGVPGRIDALVSTGANVLSIDWATPLAQIRSQLPPHVGVQGNLDPFLLTTTPEIVTSETTRILREMKGWRGHVFNLGHGVPPNAKIECIQALVETVRSFA